ncbi:MAG: DUF3846 domain-containing protein [Rhizobiales bacterium]|nr:DUF3846 domain-containing protein [Hyphomicrobiales bacterium]
MMLFVPGKGGQDVRDLTRVPTLEELQEVVGGDIEAVQGFLSVQFGTATVRCVALCNENGKHEHLPINMAATLAWERALRRIGIELRDVSGAPKEWLVGTVVVLFGDREFMEAL